MKTNQFNSSHSATEITPIYLNLYDLGGCNNACVHFLGLAFYHCAVEAHSAEYGYMGHPYRFTGLYKTSKHDSRFHLYRLRDSIEVGWTWLTEIDIDRMIEKFKTFFLGCYYQTLKKTSIDFALFLLEQLSNDPQLKHLQSSKLKRFPSYIDRIRRLSKTLEFLQYFDREKEIAEINILYFLYMKFEGNLKEICRVIKCESAASLKRCIELIKQGISNERLPLFSLFSSIELETFYDCLQNVNRGRADDFSAEEITLTEIFHQFDTITLRGRTSIDRYLNMQRDKDIRPHLSSADDENHLISTEMNRKTLRENEKKQFFARLDGSVRPLSIVEPQSQNQSRTPFESTTSRVISRRNDQTSTQVKSRQKIDPSVEIERTHLRTTVSLETQFHQRKSKEKNEMNLLDISPRRARRHRTIRKLPRDLPLNENLYNLTGMK